MLLLHCKDAFTNVIANASLCDIGSAHLIPIFLAASSSSCLCTIGNLSTPSSAMPENRVLLHESAVSTIEFFVNPELEISPDVVVPMTSALENLS